MKILIPILFFLVALASCDSENVTEPTESEESDTRSRSRAERELSRQREKIALLAHIKGVHYDTLYLVLKEYYEITIPYRRKRDSVSIKSNEAVNLISTTHQLSKQKVASLIFSFKFEALTKDEIINAWKSEQEEKFEQEEPQY